MKVRPLIAHRDEGLKDFEVRAIGLFIRGGEDSITGKLEYSLRDLGYPCQYGAPHSH